MENEKLLLINGNITFIKFKYGGTFLVTIDVTVIFNAINVTFSVLICMFPWTRKKSIGKYISLPAGVIWIELRQVDPIRRSYDCIFMKKILVFN